MSSVARPIIKQIKDSRDALDFFEKVSLPEEDEKTQDIIMNFPTVYIHNWQEAGDFEVYVGESNDIFKRTRQHYDAASDKSRWQSKLLEKDASLFIIGHEHFNKSLTLDIENRLMHYMMSVDRVKHVYNLRDNPQTSYYPMEELDDIFGKIWGGLRKENKELFPSESAIKDSAIYKASPLHKLTKEQEKARDLIIHKVSNALKNNETRQLIFIDGEAGTGKTVLNSSTFYELYCQAEENNRNLKCFLLVNHDEQITVYEQIAEKLGLIEKYGQVVSKPTTFINNHSKDEPVDIAFVDEAHLLLTQGKQSYRGKNQLNDIMDRARVTVVMFDENQILTTEQFWEAQILEQYRNQAKLEENHIVLKKQLRMQADPATMDWIDSFTKERRVKKIPNTFGGYAIKIFANPELLDLEIQRRAQESDSALSRIIATYDWQYSSNHKMEDQVMKYWEVLIGKWHKPWNRELESELSKKEKRDIKGLAWAEQPQTINEVGSTFTIQGFDLNYAGVILGPSVKYRDGKIIFDPTASKNEKAVRNRTLSDGTKQKFGETLIQHEVRVLMTRGVNGMYIYACDPELRAALLEAAK
ncbi:MAG: DNA/RNA helicase domain-containing protein [Agathobacter sp.]|nr:DNA/RNA helicase domain-containing protein [Agathobacter sp.]